MANLGPKRLKKLRAGMSQIAQMSDGRRAKMYIGKQNVSGKVTCVVSRNADQMFRGGASTLSEARQAGTLCWMMDSTMLPFLQDTYGVEYIFTLERETGDLWVSSMADWTNDKRLFRTEDLSLMRTDRRGFALKYLPVQHMLHMPAERQLLSR